MHRGRTILTLVATSLLLAVSPALAGTPKSSSSISLTFSGTAIGSGPPLSDKFVIVRLVVSHLVELERLGSLLVKTTFQETVSVTLTLTLAFDVFLVAGEAAFVSVNVSAGRSTVPVQSLLSYSV